MSGTETDYSDLIKRLKRLEAENAALRADLSGLPPEARTLPLEVQAEIRGYHRGFALAHMPAKCGHPRFHSRDPNYGTPEHAGEETCQVCTVEAKLAQAADALEAAVRERDELIEDVESRGVALVAQGEALEAAERVIRPFAAMADRFIYLEASTPVGLHTKDGAANHPTRINTVNDFRAAADWLARHATAQRKGGGDE